MASQGCSEEAQDNPGAWQGLRLGELWVDSIGLGIPMGLGKEGLDLGLGLDWVLN